MPLLSCRTCGEEKDETHFYFRKDSGKYRTNCTRCRLAADASRRYGVSVDEVLALSEKQGHRCAICDVHKDDVVHATFKHNPLVIDHDHETGTLRGLLCSTCNCMLGLAKDRIDILASAASYLAKHHS